MKSCYKFSSIPSTYEEALRECRKEVEGEAGDLVSLHNTYEQGERLRKEKQKILVSLQCKFYQTYCKNI